MSRQAGATANKGSKVKPNAFSCFITKRRRELEATGLRFDGGFRQIAEYVSDEWKLLSPEDKAKFKKEATELRRLEKEGENNGVKAILGIGHSAFPDCANNSTAQSLMDAFNELTASQKYLKALWQTPDAVAKNAIVVYMNHYVESKCHSVSIPCEIAVVVFSIRDGLSDSYWSLVDPGAIPLGYGIEAAANAKRYGVSYPVASNVEEVVESIEKMIGTYPETLIFAPKKCFRTTTLGMKWLFQQVGKELKLKLYQFEQLVVAMSTAHLTLTKSKWMKDKSEETEQRMKALTKKKNRVAASQNRLPLVSLCGVFLSAPIVQDYMDSTMEYLCLEELACTHHSQSEDENLDACSSMIHCALTHAKRLVFLALDAFLMNYKDVKPLRGKHFPRTQL